MAGAAEELNEFLELISKREQLKVTYCKEDRGTQWFFMWGEREGVLLKGFMCVTQAHSWEIRTISMDKSPVLDELQPTVPGLGFWSWCLRGPWESSGV